MPSVSPHTVLQLEINDVTRAWGLEVGRVELAVDSVLQLPQDCPLQQLAPHLLGVGVSSLAGRALPLGQGEEPPEKGGDSAGHSAWCPARRSLATCSLNQVPLPVCQATAILELSGTQTADRAQVSMSAGRPSVACTAGSSSVQKRDLRSRLEYLRTGVWD